MTLPAGVPTELFVDGKWVAGSDGTLPVLDPSTGEVITEVARAVADDVARAVEAAGGAQPGLAATAPS
jgi:succinate-semialdehyde dehydrogenase/glutarate-semialdehyde dehydrogenase